MLLMDVSLSFFYLNWSKIKKLRALNYELYLVSE